MKYADSIKVLKNNLWNNTKCKEIVKGCDEIIQNQEGNVLLFNLNAAFLIVHASLMKHLGEIMKKN